jgi:hypothetical protein
MNNFGLNYKLILKELQKLVKIDNFYFKLRKPKINDLELIYSTLAS